MKLAEDLKKAVLQAAMQGKLTKQLKTDSSVDELLKKNADEKAKLIADGKIKKEKSLKEITEDEIPFEVPENWRWIKLGEICQTQLGKTLDRTKNKGEYVPYLCSINVGWGKFNLETVKELRLEENEKEQYLICKGDLLICEGGDVGRSAIWEHNIEMYYQNALHRVRFYSDINRYFILQLILTYKAIGLIDKVSKGMTIKHFVQGSLINLPIPLPPIEEQQRIVEKLNSILPIIDSMAVYGSKKKAGRPKQEEALTFISSLLGTKKTSESKSVTPEILELTTKAKEELPAIVKKYADLMGVTYNRITVRHQKTRWGSCTKTGNLSFNCLIMKMPENVRDYVIVHELAHRKELNHSTKFWTIVAEYCPWYKEAKLWLKENGQELMEI